MKKNEYKYLLYLYNQVNRFLSSRDVESDECFPEKLVSFCIVIEKLIKIKLYKKNHVLIFDVSNLKDLDMLVAIIDGSDKNIETIRIDLLLERCKSFFPNFLTENELSVLRDIYRIRNQFIHDYKSDDCIKYDKLDIISKMGSIWDKISRHTNTVFGKELIVKNQPKIKYTEEQLNKVLEDEVRMKIMNTELDMGAILRYRHDENYNNINLFQLGTDMCPRCGSYGFELSGDHDLFLYEVYRLNGHLSNRFLDLYKCKSCNLELTRKEYEIARKIKSNY